MLYLLHDRFSWTNMWKGGDKDLQAVWYYYRKTAYSLLEGTNNVSLATILTQFTLRGALNFVFCVKTSIYGKVQHLNFTTNWFKSAI